jgi:hypothetical protein
VKARTRNLATLLVLLTAAAEAVLLAWWGVDLRGAAEASRAERAARLFAFEPAEVKELTVQGSAGTTALVRGPQGFRIPALDAEADGGAVDSILELFAHLRRKAEVAPPGAGDAALQGYGLLHPRVRVEALLADGRRESLALGDRNAFDGSLYVRPTSGEVALAPGEIGYWLDKGPAELRRKPPPPPPSPAPPDRPPGTPGPAKPPGKAGH